MRRLRILSVGQCGYDHAQMCRALGNALEAEVTAADTHAMAIEAIRSSEPFDLVLINRIADADGARGIDLIREVVADSKLAEIPVMLVSNYPESQAEAIAAGARPGFGKSDLGTGREIIAVREALAIQG